jgi:phospholipid/cholesterol/gamma-HCH transport system permease protein
MLISSNLASAVETMNGHWCWLDEAGGAPVLKLGGAWRLGNLGEIQPALERLPVALRPAAVDGGAVEELDTAAALALLDALAARGVDLGHAPLANFDPRHARILELVRKRLPECASQPHRPTETWVAAIGRRAWGLAAHTLGFVAFLGRTLAELGETVLNPGRLRIKELTAQFEQVCLFAIPVVALVTFLIGVVVAYLLGLQAEQYGANIFVVDGVAIGMTREFSPILVATIVAGRSGAAFTAQLGTMILTEEVDAIRTLGLSPMRVLVVPRLLAIMAALPLLVFIGDVMGLAGAMAVCSSMLDITPATFLDRLHSALDLKHVVIGLAKAPVFAAFIAIIGCRMGMTVSRDTRSIGINTTSTVVQSIVAVILLDAFFAIFFQELGL